MTHRLLLCLLIASLFGCSFAARERETARPLDSADVGEYQLVQRDGTLSDLRYRFMQGEGGRWKFEHRMVDGSWADASCRGNCLLELTSPEDAARFMRGKVPGGRFASCVHNSSYAFCRAAGARGPRNYAFVSLSTGTPIAFDLERVGDDGVQAPAS